MITTVSQDDQIKGIQCSSIEVHLVLFMVMGDLNMWVYYKGSLSIVYNDMGRSQHVGGL